MIDKLKPCQEAFEKWWVDSVSGFEDFDDKILIWKVWQAAVAWNCRSGEREPSVDTIWLKKGMEVAQGFLDKPSKSHIVDMICIIGWERDKLRKKHAALRKKVEQARDEIEAGAVKDWGLIEIEDVIKALTRILEGDWDEQSRTE